MSRLPRRWTGLVACLAILMCIALASLLPMGSRYAVSSEAVASEPSSPSESSESLTAFTRKYCLDCHHRDDPAGDMELSSFDGSKAELADGSWDPTRWEKVLRRLQSRQMPPVDAERPSEQEYQHMVGALAQRLDGWARRYPRPGRTDSIRRLTRFEYQNAIRDLLALDVDVTELLPADESSHGFDNITLGDISPVLLSRYIAAAEKIARLAVGIPPSVPQGVTIRLPPDRTQEQHVAGLPLGTRGGLLILHTFPGSGRYQIQLRLTRDRDEKIEGLREPHDVDVLLDRKRVGTIEIRPPRNKDYSSVDANLVATIQAEAGSGELGVTFVAKDDSLLEVKREPFEAAFNRHRHPRRTPAIFEVSILGPLEPKAIVETPSRARIFKARPESQDDDQAARAILGPLMRRAYRRPVTEDDFQRPMQFFREHASRSFDHGIEAALSAILVNPQFLLRIEREPSHDANSDPQRITDLELASRLSFFLWSSLPDDQLLTLAEQGRLHEPQVLSEQVARMLGDDRAGALVENFASQWLYLRNLDSFSPDLRAFPDFDDNLRQSMRKETELLFAEVVSEDQSVLQLLTSDHTWLDERLARHYEIPGVQGSHFRKVRVDDQTHRGGMLRHASLLTVTSYATRTSPTIRGNWILKNIIGTPPPPPPPDVPALKDKESSAALSLRERLAEHRANPACASCHDLMDPIGFALEHFDATGQFRRLEGDLHIDASGVLPDGSEVASIDDLEKALLARPELFVQTLTERLMTYALGRGLTSHDGPAVRRVVADAKENNDRFSALVQGIVASPPFQMRERP